MAQSDKNPATTLVFYLDWNFGRVIVATAVREAGYQCEVHFDHFRQDEIDEVWLTEVGRRGWFVFTKDRNIGRRAHELAALRNANVGVILLVAKEITGSETAALIVSAMPKIHNFCASSARPFIVKLYRDGRLEKWK